MKKGIEPPYKHITPFKRCVLENFPFIEADFDALTNYGLLSEIVDYLNNVIASQNTVQTNVETLNTAFIQLKNYVDNYFEDLDVQEEINNKLDVMTEEGTLEEIIGHYIQRPATEDQLGTVQIGKDLGITEEGVISVDYDKFYFHVVSKSSATYIGMCPNGKNILIDTGKASEWVDVKAGIDSLGITKFDVIIITHFHNDHDGNIQNIINNYDCSEATWYIGMKPDFINHNEDIQSGQETLYDNGVALLSSNGITPVIPSDKSEIIIDNEHDIKIKFFNTDETVAENYYGRIGEWYDSKINLNDFSLFGFIIHNNVKIFFGGDIERPVEDAYAEEMEKVNVLTCPHHGTNLDANRAFYNALKPDYAIFTFQTSSPNWIKSFYRQFGYIYETGSDIITSYGNSTDNSLFTFVSTGYDCYSEIKNSPLTNSWYNYEDIYLDFRSCVDYTTTPKTSVTLKNICDNLPQGYTIRQKLTTEIVNAYPQIFADLLSIIPMFTNTMFLEISRIVDYGVKIRVYDNNAWFEALSNQAITTFNVKGGGSVNGISTPANLETVIEKLPIGHYTSNYYQDTTGDVLTHGYTYALDIDVTLRDTNGVSANISAITRSHSATAENTIYAVGYYRQTESNKIVWYKIG